jgi:hypothetical protein
VAMIERFMTSSRSVDDTSMPGGRLGAWKPRRRCG